MRPDVDDWVDFALCQGMPTDRFYERYESNPRLAQAMDEMCLSCPVQKICLQQGIENNEFGLWGGVFLVYGKPSTERNSHKTKEVWDQIKNAIS